MTTTAPQPAFLGTPDQWWEQAEQITEEEAAFRILGTWYITAETRSGEHTGAYRIAVPTLAANHQRRDHLARRVHEGEVRETDISPNVRALIRITEAREPWMDVEYVFADAKPHGSDRVLWRSKNGRWLQVANGSKSVGELAMSALNPVPAVITEQQEVSRS